MNIQLNGIISQNKLTGKVTNAVKVDESACEQARKEGYNIGYVEGESEGYSKGQADGIEQGKQAEYDEFWDLYQDSGKRTSYRYMFAGNGWNNETFKPKYNIISTNCQQMFTNSYIADLKACLESCGVTLDTSKATNLTQAFAYCYKLITLPKIDLSSANNSGSTFHSSSVLKTIEELVVSEKTMFSTMFNNCTALENMIVTGTIAQNGFNVQWSTKLSKASIESIINALSSTTSGLTVTISKTAKETAFTDDEWDSLITTKSNWTISLA